MCGLFGICYGPGGPEAEDWSPSELLQIMFPAIVHRGPHAYGWMANIDGDIRVTKYAGRADTPEALRTMTIDGSPKWIVGHVRYATHGDPVNLLNDHPISHKNMVGVHNGVIYNYKDVLAQTGRDNPECEVDSEAIFAAVAKWGYRKGLGKIRGDMVSIMANREKPDTLHFARTHGRPLVFCRTSEGSIMFASIPEVCEATGMVMSQFSNLSSNRLVRIKEGRIVYRLDLSPFQEKVNISRPVGTAPTHLSRQIGPRVRTGMRAHFDEGGEVVVPVGEHVPAAAILPCGEFEANPQYNSKDICQCGWSKESHGSSTPHTTEFNNRRQRGRTGQPNQNSKAQPVATVAAPKGYSASARRTPYLRDHDRWQDKVFYKGVLLSEKEYMDKLLEEVE
jgi:hypothetical protein